MSSDDTLLSLLGTYDNLGEDKPNANTRATILGATITFMLLSWTCGLFRLYTRFFIIYAPGWDDLILVCVMLVAFVGAACTCILTNVGLGQHFILLSLDQMENYLKTYYIANASYVMATTLIKISLLLQYRRIFEEQRMRLLCLVLLVAISAWGAVYTVLAWVPCVPVYSFWDLASVEPKVCFGYGALTRGPFLATYASHAAINMVFDVLVLSLPIYLCFKKNTTTRTRLGLIGLLCGGCLVVFISIWRFATLSEHKATTFPTFDPSWYSPISILLSALEVDIASICASVPVFWPVLSNSLEGIFVTKEIQITREDRADEFELNRRRSGSGGAFDQESAHSVDYNGPEMRDRKLASNFRMQGGNPFENDKSSTVQVRTHAPTLSESRTKETWNV